MRENGWRDISMRGETFDSFKGLYKREGENFTSMRQYADHLVSEALDRLGVPAPDQERATDPEREGRERIKQTLRSLRAEREEKSEALANRPKKRPLSKGSPADLVKPKERGPQLTKEDPQDPTTWSDPIQNW